MSKEITALVIATHAGTYGHIYVRLQDDLQRDGAVQISCQQGGARRGTYAHRFSFESLYSQAEYASMERAATVMRRIHKKLPALREAAWKARGDSTEPFEDYALAALRAVGVKKVRFIETVNGSYTSLDELPVLDIRTEELLFAEKIRALRADIEARI